MIPIKNPKVKAQIKNVAKMKARKDRRPTTVEQYGNDIFPTSGKSKKFDKKLRNRAIRRFNKKIESDHPVINKYCGWYW